MPSTMTGIDRNFIAFESIELQQCRVTDRIGLDYRVSIDYLIKLMMKNMRSLWLINLVSDKEDLAELCET